MLFQTKKLISNLHHQSSSWLQSLTFRFWSHTSLEITKSPTFERNHQNRPSWLFNLKYSQQARAHPLPLVPSVLKLAAWMAISLCQIFRSAILYLFHFFLLIDYRHQVRFQVFSHQLLKTFLSKHCSIFANSSSHLWIRAQSDSASTTSWALQILFSIPRSMFSVHIFPLSVLFHQVICTLSTPTQQHCT